MRIPTFQPNVPTAAQSGGFAGTMAGALQAGPQFYQQMVQNKYMAPLLQQMLMQQQQKSQQMQQATPFAGMLAQNEALRMLPMGAMMQIMENPKLLAQYPWMGNMLAGNIGTQFGRTPPTPMNTTPTPLSTRGAINSPISPTGAAIPTQQQPTWYGNIIKGGENLFNSVKNSLGSNQAPVANIAGNNNIPQSSQNAISSSGNIPVNANLYPWMNSNIPAAQKASKITQLAQQEYEAEHGKGTWTKAPPTLKKQQWDMIYSGIKQSMQHPNG